MMLRAPSRRASTRVSSLPTTRTMQTRSMRAPQTPSVDLQQAASVDLQTSPSVDLQQATSVDLQDTAPVTQEVASLEDPSQDSDDEEISEEDPDEEEDSDDEEEEEVPCCNCGQIIPTGQWGECKECGHIQCDRCQHYNFWDCCFCRCLTKNDIETNKCPQCKHTKCTARCRDWGDARDPEEGDDSFRIELMATDRLGLNVKMAKIALSRIISSRPLSPLDPDYLVQSFGAQAVKNVPPEIILYILELAHDISRPRTLYALWNPSEQAWSYRDPRNKVPRTVIKFDSPLLTARASELRSAPRLGLGDQPYAWFNPTIDTLAFVYNRCGNEPEDVQQYEKAMAIAGQHITRHANKHPSRAVRKLEIEWCQFVQHPKDTVSQFDNNALEQLTLVDHDHFNPAYPSRIYEQHEDYAQRLEWASKTLAGFNFKVIWEGSGCYFNKDYEDETGESAYDYDDVTDS